MCIQNPLPNQSDTDVQRQSRVLFNVRIALDASSAGVVLVRMQANRLLSMTVGLVRNPPAHLIRQAHHEREWRE